jgi:undecaprenyl-diphosphatase
MLSYIQAAILGVVEGLTEFLPISSTGHLVLASALLKIPETDFVKSFEIIIQLGAILAVVAAFVKKFFSWELIKRLVVAFVPTGVLGLLLYKVIKTYLLGNIGVVVWSLALGGLVLFFFEKFLTPQAEEILEEEVFEKIKTLSYRDAFIIGLCQALAMIPGVSRSGATIVGAMFLKHSRRVAVEFSFLLAVPTMLAASGLDILKNYRLFTFDTAGVLAVGFLVSAATAFVAVRWLLKK